MLLFVCLKTCMLMWVMLLSFSPLSPPAIIVPLGPFLVKCKCLPTKRRSEDSRPGMNNTTTMQIEIHEKGRKDMGFSDLQNTRSKEFRLRIFGLRFSFEELSVKWNFRSKEIFCWGIVGRREFLVENLKFTSCIRKNNSQRQQVWGN